MTRSSPTQTHYATVFQVGLDGSPQQGKFFGSCLVLGCPWATPFFDTEDEARALVPEHSRAFPDLPEGGVDWYGGRPLQPWEENYPEESQRGILLGPGGV